MNDNQTLPLQGRQRSTGGHVVAKCKKITKITIYEEYHKVTKNDLTTRQRQQRNYFQVTFLLFGEL